MTAGTKQERTYIMIKPDGVQRGLIGDIVRRPRRDPNVAAPSRGASSNVRSVERVVLLMLSKFW